MNSLIALGSLGLVILVLWAAAYLAMECYNIIRNRQLDEWNRRQLAEEAEALANLAAHADAQVEALTGLETPVEFEPKKARRRAVKTRGKVVKNKKKAAKAKR